jgi:hypothetical protein
MEARSSRTAWYSSASLAGTQRNPTPYTRAKWWVAGTTETSLGRVHRRNPTLHTRVKWRVVARRRSHGMTRRRRRRWDPWRPGHGGQGEACALPRWHWRMLRTLS